MKRLAILLYGIVCYAIFFATFLYALGFVGGFGVPTTLDGAARGSLWQALLVDAGLLGLFAVQHSVMARPGFKRLWTRIVPAPAERSTYVLFSSLALIAMFVLWQPIAGSVWSITDPVGRAAAYALFGFGWGLVLLSTFLINHFDLFGLRQVWLYVRGKPYTHLPFKTPGPYKWVRHPLYVGWLFAFWATPEMTTAHLVFAVMTTGYILVAIRFEERDLVRHLGARYAAYRRQVPMLIPRLRPRRDAVSPTA